MTSRPRSSAVFTTQSATSVLPVPVGAHTSTLPPGFERLDCLFLKGIELEAEQLHGAGDYPPAR
jgi:hypothetical protein